MSKYSTDHSNDGSAPIDIQTQTEFIDTAILSIPRKDQKSNSKAHLIRQLNIIDTYIAELSTILLVLSQQLQRDQRKC